VFPNLSVVQTMSCVAITGPYFEHAMPQNLDVVVAQYGHAKLPGAKHWAIVVITNRGKLKGVAYQLTGSTETYEIKQPEEIWLLGSRTYMGNIKVGTVYGDYAFGVESAALCTIIQHTPLVRGDLNWNCQNWVVAALKRLKDAQHNISGEISIRELQAQFAEVQREDM
jgi:hypothetical protein